MTLPTRIKTLLVTSDFPPKGGGISRHVECVADGLDDLLVLAPIQGWDAIIEMDKHYGVIHYYADYSTLWKTLWSIGSLRNFMRCSIRQFNHEVVLCADTLPCGVVAAFLLGKYKRPFVLMTYGNDVLEPKSSWWRSLLQKAVYRRANKIIAISSFTKSLVTDVCPDVEQACVVINPAVDMRRFPKV